MPGLALGRNSAGQKPGGSPKGWPHDVRHPSLRSQHENQK